MIAKTEGPLTKATKPNIKKLESRKLIIVVVALFIVAGTAYASWVFIIKPKLDPTTNWQVYRSQECGYEIKYPPDYRVKKIELTEFDWKHNPGMAEIYKEGVSFKRNDKSVVFLISVNDNPLKLSPRQWVTWAKKDPLLDEGVAELYRDEIINGMQAIRLDTETPNQIDANIILVEDTQVFEIDYVENPKDGKNNKDVFEIFLENLKVD